MLKSKQAIERYQERAIARDNAIRQAQTFIEAVNLQVDLQDKREDLRTAIKSLMAAQEHNDYLIDLLLVAKRERL